MRLFTAVNCSEPPPKPDAGTWEWNGDYEYGTNILYTCGPYGNFRLESGELYEDLVVTCAWNKSWTPSPLDPCGGMIDSMKI